MSFHSCKVRSVSKLAGHGARPFAPRNLPVALTSLPRAQARAERATLGGPEEGRHLIGLLKEIPEV